MIVSQKVKNTRTKKEVSVTVEDPAKLEEKKVKSIQKAQEFIEKAVEKESKSDTYHLLVTTKNKDLVKVMLAKLYSGIQAQQKYVNFYFANKENYEKARELLDKENVPYIEMEMSNYELFKQEEQVELSEVTKTLIPTRDPMKFTELASPKKTIFTIVKEIQSRLHTKIYTAFDVEEVQKSGEGIYFGIRAFIGKNQAVRFNWKSNQLDSIDFWTTPSFQPTLTSSVVGLSNEEIVEIIIDVLEKPEAGEVELEENYTLKEDDNSMIDGAKAWFKFLGDKRESIINNTKIAALYDMYTEWFKNKKYNNGSRFQYIQGHPKFTSILNSALGRAKRGAVVKTAPTEKPKVDEKEEELLDEQLTNPMSGDEIFEQVESFVKLVCKGVNHSLVITGAAGIGKSYAVIKAVKESGAKYKVFKGNISSGLALYQTLYEYNDQVVIFDDCDKVLDDEVAVNILKGALDSYDTRIISYRSKTTTGDKAELPAEFEYTGRIIFISNYFLSQIDSAIISRSLTIDVDLTPEQTLERIKMILPDILPKVDMKIKKEVLDFLLSIKGIMAKLNIRTFQQAISIRMTGNPNWQKWVVAGIQQSNKIVKRGAKR